MVLWSEGNSCPGINEETEAKQFQPKETPGEQG